MKEAVELKELKDFCKKDLQEQIKELEEAFSKLSDSMLELDELRQLFFMKQQTFLLGIKINCDCFKG